MKPIAFYYEFASPYSYISMMRIEELTAPHGIEVIYQPFLIGPLFKEVGWETSPFLIYEAKGKNFFRDIVREADHYGLPPLQILDEFPQRGLRAARVALLGMGQGWGVAFSKAVYRRQFQQGLPIIGESDVKAVMSETGIGDVIQVYEQAQGEENKERLFQIVNEAKALGLYGAPSFVVGDDLFWGNDRLERAISYALRD